MKGILFQVAPPDWWKGVDAPKKFIVSPVGGIIGLGESTAYIFASKA